MTSEAPHDDPADVVFSITPQDANVLQHYLDQFREGDTPARTLLIDRVMGELYRSRPENSSFDMQDVKQKIQKWFYNHYSSPRREYIKFTRKWSARNAFHQCNRDEVVELVKEQSGLSPGHPQFLGALQRAATTLWNEQDDDNKADYVQAAKDWTVEAPPSHIQSRMAASMRKCIIQDFQSQLYRTCGIRSLVLTAYESEDHDLKISMDDVHAVLDDGLDFKKFCPDWKYVNLWEKWTDFGVKCFSQDTDEGPEVEVPTRENAEPIPVPLDDMGFPELPPTPKSGVKLTKVVQSMVREYCLAHVRFTTGNENTIIPWGALAKEPSSWVDSACTPADFEWKDPSKMRIAEAHHLLEHWRGRIAGGLASLIWVPTSPLFEDQDDIPDHEWRFREHIEQPHDSSDEEVFVLPQSDEIDEDEDQSNNDEQHPYSASHIDHPYEDAMEEVMDASDVSHPDEDMSTPSNVWQHSVATLSDNHPSDSGIAGPSDAYIVQGSRQTAAPRPYPVKGEWYIEVPRKPK